MYHNVIYSMSSKELSRRDIILKHLRRELTQEKAAKLIGVGDRRVRAIVAAYLKYGDIVFVSNKRGKKSNRAKPQELKDEVLSLIQEHYHDFGPTLAAEKLLERHNIKLHHGTVRNWMIEAGIFKDKTRKKANIHQSRERRDCFGELVQIDGSHHDWFEGRRDKCCLIVFIDDATGLTYCRYEESETTLGYMRATKDYIQTYGKPVSFYSDKHTIFKSPGNVTKPNETQFQRACRELNISLICANTPQAKGRVERVNGTLQDRLVKELRLNNINTIEQANEFLPEFLQKFNQKFIKQPKSEQDLHTANTLTDKQLDYILSKHEQRRLSKNLEFNFKTNIYQIVTKTIGYTLRHSQITITENTNHEIKVFYKGREYDYKIIDKSLRTQVTDNKNLHNVIQLKTQRKNFRPAAPDSPYRKAMDNFFRKPVVSKIRRTSLNNFGPDLSK